MAAMSLRRTVKRLVWPAFRHYERHPHERLLPAELPWLSAFTALLSTRRLPDRAHRAHHAGATARTISRLRWHWADDRWEHFRTFASVDLAFRGSSAAYCELAACTANGTRPVTAVCTTPTPPFHRGRLVMNLP